MRIKGTEEAGWRVIGLRINSAQERVKWLVVMEWQRRWERMGCNDCLGQNNQAAQNEWKAWANTYMCRGWMKERRQVWVVALKREKREVIWLDEKCLEWNQEKKWCRES
jgi:hypothetical protein